MTLEELQAKFAILQEERMGDSFHEEAADVSTIEHWTKFFRDSVFDGRSSTWKTTPTEDQMIEVATIYVLLRDQGLDAALLWKLQNVR